MRPPLRVQLDFDFSLLLSLIGYVSLNSYPRVRDLCLGTVNADSIRHKAPALSDLVTSKGIDLLGITDTWLTTKETSADLVAMTSKGFSFFHEARAGWRRGRVGLFMSSVHKFSTISLPTLRVVVLFGPIDPSSKAGHSYILTLIDNATRYPEAVPLKTINTETVAEALVVIYSRLGIQEEVLSDQGAQFISDWMKEVCKLLGVSQSTTTPYHPMCNDLVDKLNGTLKKMLKRLCSE